MKKITTFLNIFFTLILFTSINVKAQEVKGNKFYSNNFDNGAIGAAITQISADASLKVSSTSAIQGNNSLSSNGTGKLGVYNIDVIPTNTNLDNETIGWEWNFSFKANNTSTDSKNYWKYWLTKEDNTDDSKGVYITQDDNKLYLKYYSNKYYTASWEICKITKNSSLNIRVQRGTDKWKVYVNDLGDSPNGAYTLELKTGYKPDNKDYYTSQLEVISTAENRFQFDNLKFFSILFNVSAAGANNPENGISSPIFPDQKDVIIYGVKIQTRGFLEVSQIKIDLSGQVNNIFKTGINAAKLYSSEDNYYDNNTDTYLTNVDLWSSSLQKYYYTINFYSLGNADGSINTTKYLYFTANTESSIPENATFKVDKISTFQSQDNWANYADNEEIVQKTETSNIESGNLKKWTGKKSSSWEDANNWNPKAVPSTKDLVRIGFDDFDNQPIINSNQEIGRLEFGDEEEVTLSINANTSLSVNSNFEGFGEFTIKGDGTLNIKDNFKVSLTDDGNANLNLKFINTNNFTINASKKSPKVEINNLLLTVNNTLNSVGNKNNEFNLSANSKLILNGENPLSFSSSTKVDFSTGTVEFAGNQTQSIPVNYKYFNLNFNGTGTKTISAGELNIKGDFYATDGKIDFLTNKPSVLFNGNDQSINDNGVNEGVIFFNNVTFSGNTKTLSSNGKFIFAPGASITLKDNTVLKTNDNLRLNASSTSTAWVNTIPKNASIIGKATVEKYVAGGDQKMWRTYRMLSSPVYDNTNNFINSDVAGNRSYKFSQLIDDIIITGKGGSANGFDISPTNAASAWTYNNGYKAIPNINTSENIGRGIYIFFRGDRSNYEHKVNAPFLDPEGTIITFTGNLNQQDVTVPLVHGSGGFSLIGNPYAATVDWNAVKKTNNVGKIVRYFNPSIKQYATFNGSIGNNGAERYIGPGQAVFIQTTNNNSPSITFTEDSKAKSTVQAEDLFNKTMSVKDNLLNIDGLGLGVMSAGINNSTLNVQPESVIRVVLTKDNSAFADEAVVVLKEGGLNEANEMAVARSGGEGVYMSSLSDNNGEMAINYFNPVAETNNIKLGVKADATGTYNINLNLAEIPSGFNLNLIDKYLNTKTAINNSVVDYNFAIDKNVAATFGNERFEISITPPTTLPVELINFTASKVAEGVKLSWNVKNEVNHQAYALYRAGDNKVYTKIAVIENGNANQYIDKNPLLGNNYYQLVQIDKDGKSTVFKPITINYELNNSIQNLVVYPTKINQYFNLKYNGSLNSETYELSILNSSGKLVLNKTILKTEVQNGCKNEVKNLTSGTYIITLAQKSNGTIIGSAKFIKE